MSVDRYIYNDNAVIATRVRIAWCFSCQLFLCRIWFFNEINIKSIHYSWAVTPICTHRLQKQVNWSGWEKETVVIINGFFPFIFRFNRREKRKRNFLCIRLWFIDQYRLDFSAWANCFLSSPMVYNIVCDVGCVNTQLLLCALAFSSVPLSTMNPKMS